MSIFRSEIIIEGKLISGRIKNGRFHMNGINTSSSLNSSVRLASFTKEQLETVISELEKIKDRL